MTSLLFCSWIWLPDQIELSQSIKIIYRKIQLQKELIKYSFQKRNFFWSKTEFYRAFKLWTIKGFLCRYLFGKLGWISFSKLGRYILILPVWCDESFIIFWFRIRRMTTGWTERTHVAKRGHDSQLIGHSKSLDNW